MVGSVVVPLGMSLWSVMSSRIVNLNIFLGQVMAGKGRTYSFDEEAPPDDPSQPKFIYSRSISAAVYLAHVSCPMALRWTRASHSLYACVAR